MQLVILGKGDRKYEEFFHWAAQQYHGRMAVRLDYNEELSMAIYSGADLFLMPSKSEPCGLSQMIAMRYGTVPIVRETGGLKDTVHAYEAWRDSGNGFSFANYSSSDMLHVINDAVFLYKDYPDAFARLRRRAMECDFSWARSAKDYLRIYATITGQSWPVEESVPFEAAPAAEAAEAVEKAAPEAEAAAETVPAEEAAAPVEEAPKKRVRKKAPVAAEAAAAAEEAPKKRVRKKVPVAAEAAAAAEEAPKKRVKKTAAKKAEGEEKKPARKTVKKAAGKTAAKTEE